MSKYYVNSRQITVHQNSKMLLEFNDRLDYAEVEMAANLHSQYSKIKVVAEDYSKGKGDKKIQAQLNLDPEVAKYIAEMILTGKMTEFYEQKMLGHKVDENGLCEVTIFSIKFVPEMNNPWQVIVENGTGVAENNAATGGSSLKRGTYKSSKKVTFNISKMKFDTMLIQVRDYIRNFEVIALGRLLPKRKEYEKAQAEAKRNAS